MCKVCSNPFAAKRFNFEKDGKNPLCPKHRKSDYFGRYYQKNKRKFKNRRRTKDGIFPCDECGLLVEKKRVRFGEAVYCDEHNSSGRKRKTKTGIFPCSSCSTGVYIKRYKESMNVLCGECK